MKRLIFNDFWAFLTILWTKLNNFSHRKREKSLIRRIQGFSEPTSCIKHIKRVNNRLFESWLKQMKIFLMIIMYVLKKSTKKQYVTFLWLFLDFCSVANSYEYKKLLNFFVWVRNFLLLNLKLKLKKIIRCSGENR